MEETFPDSPIFPIETALNAMADGRCPGATLYGILDEQYAVVESWLDNVDEEDPCFEGYDSMLEGIEALSEALDADDGRALWSAFRELQKVHQALRKLKS